MYTKYKQEMKEATNINIKNSKVLIVDDEVEILKLLKMVLLKEGFENIYIAENEKEALKLFEETSPDSAIKI